MPPRDPMGRQRLLIILLAAAVLAGFARAAAAHPHVWATVRSEILFGPDHRITGVRHAWTFDEFYTAMAVEGLDVNKDGVYSKEERCSRWRRSMSSRSRTSTISPSCISARTRSRCRSRSRWIIRSNTTRPCSPCTSPLPLETPLDPKAQQVSVDVYDPSFFVAFGFATDAPVKISGTPAPGCAAEVEKPDPEGEADAKALSEAFFSQLGPNSNFGSQFAQTAIVKCTTR